MKVFQQDLPLRQGTPATRLGQDVTFGGARGRMLHNSKTRLIPVADIAEAFVGDCERAGVRAGMNRARPRIKLKNYARTLVRGGPI